MGSLGAEGRGGGGCSKVGGPPPRASHPTSPAGLATPRRASLLKGMRGFGGGGLGREGGGGVAFPTPTPAVHLGKGEEGEGGREKVSLNRYPYQNAICQPRTPAWGGGGGGGGGMRGGEANKSEVGREGCRERSQKGPDWGKSLKNTQKIIIIKKGGTFSFIPPPPPAPSPCNRKQYRLFHWGGGGVRGEGKETLP